MNRPDGPAIPPFARWKMSRWLVILLVGLLVGFGALGLAKPSHAQALSFEEVRSCLCQEEGISQLRGRLPEHEAARNEHEQRLGQLEATIADFRRLMDPESPIDQNTLKGLLAQRERQRERLRYEVRAAERDTVTWLNDAVTRYNAECTERPMMKPTIAAAKAELGDPPQCPAP
jgi:TolA-binding protein